MVSGHPAVDAAAAASPEAPRGVWRRRSSLMPRGSSSKQRSTGRCCLYVDVNHLPVDGDGIWIGAVPFYLGAAFVGFIIAVLAVELRRNRSDPPG